MEKSGHAQADYEFALRSIRCLARHFRIRLCLALINKSQGLPLHRLSITPSLNARLHVPERFDHDRWEGTETRFTTDEFAAFIGLDWADTKHDICLQVAGSDKREFQVLEHRPEVIEAWAMDLLQRFQGRPIAIALELNKGPIVEALRKYDGLVLFHIDPMMLARYREAFTPSRAKDDPTDAELQLDLLLRHRDKLQPLAPQSPEMRALSQLVEHRRRLVADRVRITNRLTSA